MKWYNRETVPTMRVRCWFTADDVAWFVTRALAWAGVGASVGYAGAITAMSAGVI